MPISGYENLQPATPRIAGYDPPTIGGYDNLGSTPEAGIVSTIAREIGLDIMGGLNVANASAGELLGLLGFAAPVTFEDLTARDIKGAMMLGALGVGGFVASGAAKLPLIGQLAARGAGGRLASSTLIEAASGAAVGLIRPLEDNEERMKAVFGDAAWGGAFGAGFSLVRSGWKAAMSGRVAQIKAEASRIATGKALQHLEAETLVKESAGVILYNPATKARQTVRRLADGGVQRTIIDTAGAVTKDEQLEFGVALAKAVEDGFTENLGINSKFFDRSLIKQLDAPTIEALKATNFDVTKAMQPIQISEYAAVRQAAELRRAAGAELGSLAGEVLAPTQGLGIVSLPSGSKAALINELRLSGNLLKQMSDGDILREGFRKGLITVDTAKSGIDMDLYFRDLFISDRAPGVDIVVNSRRDAVLTSILKPFRLAKLHPEFAPIYERATAASALEEEGRTIFEQKLSSMVQRVGTKGLNTVARIIDDTAIDGDIMGSRQAAIQAALATGDKQLADVTTEMTELMAKYLERAQAAGIVEDGISGYMPLVVANKWRLNVNGLTKEQLAEAGGKLFYPTKKAALEAVESLRSKGHNITYDLSVHQLWHPMEVQSGETAERIHKAVNRAFGQPAKKSTGFAKQRTIGIRDFSEDAYEALSIYGASMERALSWRTFARDVDPFVQRISPSQPRLRAATDQYIADMLGKPRPQEEVFQAAVETISQFTPGWEPAPRALKKYTSALRRWETTFRLGGPFSAIVNTTQVLTNTQAVLGPKWTAAGMDALMGPSKYRAAMDTLHKHGFKLSHVMPFGSEADMVAAFGSPRAALKEKRYVEALHRMAMFLFNGSEKTNRLVTAWGAFKKGLAEGLDEKSAASYAEEVVNRTQFVQRISDTPELLRGPAGALLLQFKSFVINEIDFVASLNKQEALRFGAAVGALGGMAVFMNMPGADLAEHASAYFTDKKLSEHSMLASREGVAQTVFFTGLPGLLNVDMSDVVGLGTVGELSSNLFGPAVKDTQHLYEFMKDAALDLKANGTISGTTLNKFVQQAGPSAVRRALRGHDIFATGEVRNAYSGKLVYRPERRLSAALKQTIGFPDLDAARERAADEVALRVRDNYIKARSGYAKKAALAALENNMAEVERIRNEARVNQHDIDDRTLKYWMRELGRTAPERREKRTPAALRAEYSELFEATGTLGSIR